MSQIIFEFYGRLERLASQSEYTLATDTPVSLEQALKALAAIKPDIHDNLERCACAIGDELVARSTVVNANTRIALLPPVAGG